jgi:hypothetical protein
LSIFIDIFAKELIKNGEELCGDKVKTFKTDDKTILVLSDGLGSGVKANILATLTSEIIVTMIKAEIPIEDVIDTVLHTLPVCKVRKIAYATFTIIEIDKKTRNFRVINFDNPPVFFMKKGKLQSPVVQTVDILGRKINIIEDKLDKGDFIAAVSDGVLYAGIGESSSFGWKWEDVASYIENLLIPHWKNARSIVGEISNRTLTLSKGELGDDATIAGIYAKERNQLILFSGPPEDEDMYDVYTELLFMFNGRRVVCGGTTTSIVSSRLGEEVEILIPTATNDIPPVGKLSEIDLVTEGIVTLSKAVEYLKKAHGDFAKLPSAIDAAVILAKELLRADYIYVIAGLGINKVSQFYMKPTRISVRKSIITDLSNILQECNKEVVVHYC